VPWWLWLNVLSLDAPIVALLWQAALATAYKVYLPQACYLTLGLAVWLIYLVDHTLDAFSLPAPQKLTARHAFFRRNRMLFAIFVIPVTTALVLLLAATAIPVGVMARGIALGFLVGMYLLHYAARSQRWLYLVGNIVVTFGGGYVLWMLPLPETYKLIYMTVLASLLVLSFTQQRPEGFRIMPKELLCGYFFAVGSSLCVNFYTFEQHAGPFSPETLLFGLLCALNCIAIACYERETDAVGDPNAITRTWPGLAKAYPMLLLSLAGLALYTMTQPWNVRMVATCIGAVLFSTILLAALHHLAKRLHPELSHVLADAALAVPMLAVIFLV
jgi:hypothetical protein